MTDPAIALTITVVPEYLSQSRLQTVVSEPSHQNHKLIGLASGNISDDHDERCGYL